MIEKFKPTYSCHFNSTITHRKRKRKMEKKTYDSCIDDSLEKKNQQRYSLLEAYNISTPMNYDWEPKVTLKIRQIFEINQRLFDYILFNLEYDSQNYSGKKHLPCCKIAIFRGGFSLSSGNKENESQ